MNSAHLQMHGIVKSFGPTQALRGVGPSLDACDVHALIKENGAGKSTLVKILSGAERPELDVNRRRVEESLRLLEHSEIRLETSVAELNPASRQLVEISGDSGASVSSAAPG